MRMLAAQQGGGGAGGAPPPPPAPLFSLKCGLMQSTPVAGGASTSLKADKKKGELVLKKDPDGMLHVQWVDRGSGNLRFDRPVFPGDVTLKRINAPNVRCDRTTAPPAAAPPPPTQHKWPPANPISPAPSAH